MSNSLFVHSDNDERLVITGEITKILGNRRANRLLKDTLDCRIGSDQIEVTVVAGIQHCLDRVNYIAKLCGLNVLYSDQTDESINAYIREEERFAEFSEKALSIRNNDCDINDFLDFKNVLIEYMPNRTLYDLQLLSAYHLAFSQNACNFSVPGAGKTSVVYGAYAYLKQLNDGLKKVDYLLIIGPLSSFAPWELEYEECFGKKPTSKRLTGNMALDEKKQYLYESTPSDITMLSYSSVIGLVEELKYFLKKNRVMVVLDEAHKIKNNSGGIISQSVLSLASYAAARVILTGTPAPNGYEDLNNLFKFIWPSKKIIRFQPGQLKDMSRNIDDYRVKSLVDQISPYFIRVKKADLNIPAPIVHPPIKIKMKDDQRRIYDFIESRYIRDVAENKDKQFRSILIKARLIRLMQAATNPALLSQPLKSFALEEGIDLSEVDEDTSLISSVIQYENNQVPAKFETTSELVKKIISEKQKVVIWACYVKTIEQLSVYLMNQGIYNKVLYGQTPVASDIIDPESEEYELTREAIVAQFNKRDSGLNVLIANPFAVAESISLHKACHNAIYVERSFNAAHFMQSKDRIHRYGLPPGTETHYYYLVSEDSIDETIDERLTIKEQRLIEIIESMPIPLFSNVLSDDGREDVKAVLRDYARRNKTL